GPIELSKEFGIAQNLLQKWVKNGNIKCMTECRRCGHIIRTGELCSRCKTEVATGLKNGNPETKYAGRIHNRNRKG
ncbi:MAG: hypothetical protein NC307_15855, partial [Roseburia sp.]|nr:hypothetical protein [Roseburia sp.]